MDLLGLGNRLLYMEEESLQFKFEEFCADKFLKFSKISEFVYEFPEKEFGGINGRFFLDFSQERPSLKVKLKGFKYVNLELSQIEMFRNNPEYHKTGFFGFRMKTENVFGVFEEVYEILSQLEEDLGRLGSGPCKASLAAFSFGSVVSNFVVITESKYREVYKAEPLMWFGDFFLVFSNDLAKNELFIECFFELKFENVLKSFYKRTQFGYDVGLKEVLEYFGIKFHEKFKITLRLYKCMYKKPDAWMDFFVEKMSQNTWKISPQKSNSFSLIEDNITKSFLESCREKIQFNLITSYSLKKSD